MCHPITTLKTFDHLIKCPAFRFVVSQSYAALFLCELYISFWNKPRLKKQRMERERERQKGRIKDGAY